MVGTPQRARKNAYEFHSLEPFSQAASVTFAPLCEWQVGKPGVLSAQRPRGFAVTGKVDCLMRYQWFSPRTTTGTLWKSVGAADLFGT